MEHETDSLFAAIDAIRATARNMPMQQALALLAIARQPGITSRELMAQAGIGQSSVSRNTMALGKTRRDGRPGLGFIRVDACLLDSRRNTYWLTPRGIAAVTKAKKARPDRAHAEGLRAVEQALAA